MVAGDTPATPPGGEDTSSDAAAEQLLAQLLRDRALTVSFRPVNDLRSGQIVAVEALVAGPADSPLADPSALLAVARRSGRLAELEWVGQAAIFTAFANAGVPPSVSLFVSVAPEARSIACPPDLLPIIRRAESHLRIFVEVDDRALVADPAGVLAAVDRARELGWGVAVVNVGASPSPVAMLPIVAPDVVQLNLTLLADTGRDAASEIITSVLRYTEKAGATLLAEGVTTREDALWARVLGATYGQGDLVGSPGALGSFSPAPPPIPLIRVAPTDLHVASPFELFEGGLMVTASAEHLAELAGVFARRPHTSGCPSVFLLCVGDDDLPPELVAAGTPESAMVFVAFGNGMEPEPVPGARGVRLPRGDAFSREKFLIVLSDQAPAAVFARTSGPETYDVVVTQDFELVHEIARHIIRRVPVLGADNTAIGGAAGDEDDPFVDDVTEEESPTKSSWRGWRSARS